MADSPPPPEAGSAERRDAAGAPPHELRTLLNEIIGYSELLREEAQDWGHEGLARDLGKIRAAGLRLLSFSDRLEGPPRRTLADDGAQPRGAPSGDGPRRRRRPRAEPRGAELHRDVSGRVALDIDPRAILKVGAVLFGLWILVRAWSVVVLLGIALMLVATLSPLIRRLEARFHRRYGIILICVALVAGLAGLLGILLPPLLRQGQSLAQHFPEYTQAIEGALRRWRVPVSLASLTQGYRAQAAPQLLSAATVLFGGIVELVMIALLTIYLLIDGPRVQLGLIRLFPRTERLSVRQVLDTLTEQVGSYVRGQLLTSGAAGIFSFLLLIACHVPEPLALAVWMMVADAIPLIGLVLGTVPAVLLALTQSPTTAVIVGVGYLVYHQIEIAVLVPWVYGSRMKLSGSAILVSILVGGKLMGIVGALVALPLAAAAPVVIRHLGQWRDRQADRLRGGGDGGVSPG